jgi:hypothetical protein
MEAIYITDPAVAASYHVPVGSFISVDSGEAAWLVASHHGYELTYPTAFPKAGYVNPLAPPYEPYHTDPPGSQAALMTFTITETSPGHFEVMFGSKTDTVDATATFDVINDIGAPLANVTYTQPAGTSRQNAAQLLYTALQPHSTLALVKNGAAVDISGGAGVTVGGVNGDLSIPLPLSQGARKHRARALS